MKNKENISVEFISLSSQVESPTFNINDIDEYQRNGNDNKLPYLLTELYTEVAMHSAIINRKTNLIKGLGLQHQDGTPYLEMANPFETWNDLFEKISNDFAMFYESYLKVGWERGGARPSEYFHTPQNSVRASIPNDFNFSEMYYVNTKYRDTTYKWATWTSLSEPHITPYIAFNTKYKKEVQMLHMVKYNPVTNYGLPDYVSALKDLDTLKEISTFHNANMHNNMQPGFKFVFTGGNPDEKTKKKITDQIKEKYASASNTGKAMYFFVPEGTKTEIEPIAVSDISKMFALLSRDVKENILVSHSIDRTTAGIEGVKGFSSGKDVLFQLDKFVTNYVKPIQTTILEYINMLTGEDLKIGEIPTNLLLTTSIDELSKVLTIDKIGELMGFAKEDILSTQPLEDKEIKLSVFKKALNLLKNE